MPWPFAYYVFSSTAEEPTPEEREAGVYLVANVDAQALGQFLDPLYDSHGIGLCTSDDAIIAGGEALEALRTAVRQAIAEISSGPEEWPLTVGHRNFAFNNPEMAIIKIASRARLLEFLERAEVFATQALETDGFLHWGGGG